MSPTDDRHLTLVGAGLAGPLLAILTNPAEHAMIRMAAVIEVSLSPSRTP